LQVEHPVTEEVTGIDLVACQLHIASGEPIGWQQDDVGFDGHAIEARVYAEDPARDFLPTGGTVLLLDEPRGLGLGVDSGRRVRANPVPPEVFAAAALDELLMLRPTGPVVDPWEVPNGWRIDGAAGTAFRLDCAGQQVTVRVVGGPEAAEVSVDGADPVPAAA